jgi:hypothetical protein
MKAAACLLILMLSGCAAAQPSATLNGVGATATSQTASLADWPKEGLPGNRTVSADGMKGYELHSAQSRSGDWHYFLVDGTNRMKRADEILAAGSTVGASAMAARLAKLPRDASVSWITNSARLHVDGTIPGLGLPPQDAIAAMQTAGREAGVILTVD